MNTNTDATMDIILRFMKNTINKQRFVFAINGVLLATTDQHLYKTLLIYEKEKLPKMPRKSTLKIENLSQFGFDFDALNQGGLVLCKQYPSAFLLVKDGYTDFTSKEVLRDVNTLLLTRIPEQIQEYIPHLILHPLYNSSFLYKRKRTNLKILPDFEVSISIKNQALDLIKDGKYNSSVSLKVCSEYLQSEVAKACQPKLPTTQKSLTF